jgi:hypothetical protein
MMVMLSGFLPGLQSTSTRRPCLPTSRFPGHEDHRRVRAFCVRHSLSGCELMAVCVDAVTRRDNLVNALDSASPRVSYAYSAIVNCREPFHFGREVEWATSALRKEYR